MNRINRQHIAKKKDFRHYSLLKYISALAVVFLMGCNSDIFMEDPHIPDIRDVSIKGDGGEWQCAVPMRGLQGLSVDYPSQDKEYVNYYYEGGGTDFMKPPNAKIIGFSYYSPLSFYSVGLDDQMLYVRSEYSSVTQAFTVRLNYDDGLAGYIHVTLQQGKPLEFLYERPMDELSVNTEETPETFTDSFVNNTFLAQKMEIYPYMTNRSFLRVTPAENWAKGIAVSLNVPHFDGSGWELEFKEDVVLGQIYEFTPHEAYIDEKIAIEVPPGKKASVRHSVTYQRGRQNVALVFHNQVDGRDWEVECEAVARYPVSYEYEVHYE